MRQHCSRLMGALVLQGSFHNSMDNKSKFIKVWKVVFKYLYMVMLAVLIFRTGVMVLHEGWSFLKVGNVLLGVGIATAGIAFVSAMIALYAVIQDSKTNKPIKRD